MTIDEKDAIDTARRDVSVISALLEALSEKAADKQMVLCLCGLEALADSVIQHLAAITGHSGIQPQ